MFDFWRTIRIFAEQGMIKVNQALLAPVYIVDNVSEKILGRVEAMIFFDVLPPRLAKLISKIRAGDQFAQHIY